MRSPWIKGGESGAGRLCAIFPGIGSEKAKLANTQFPIRYLHDDTIEYPNNWSVYSPYENGSIMCLYDETMKPVMTWDANVTKEDKIVQKLKLYDEKKENK